MSPATIEATIERAALDLFASMQWQTANVYAVTLGPRVATSSGLASSRANSN